MADCLYLDALRRVNDVGQCLSYVGFNPESLDYVV
jgi:hypothetical protein